MLKMGLLAVLCAFWTYGDLRNNYFNGSVSFDINLL